MSINQFLSGLPAIIAILGFVTYQLLRRFEKGDKLTQSIIDKLKISSPELAEKYSGLRPAQLEQLLKQDQALKKLVTEEDYKLLGMALRHQFIKSIIVYVIVVILFVTGLIMYVRTPNQPSAEEKAALVNAFATLNEDNKLLRDTITNYQTVLRLSPNAPPPTELLQRVKKLEAHVTELDEYKRRYGGLPDALSPSMRSNITKTLEMVHDLESAFKVQPKVNQ